MASTQAPTLTREPRVEALSLESRNGRLRRHGHRVGLYVGAGLVVALLLGVVVLASANSHQVRLDWAFGSTDASLAWVMVIAAVAGWLAGLATAATVRRRTRKPR